MVEKKITADEQKMIAEQIHDPLSNMTQQAKDEFWESVLTRLGATGKGWRYSDADPGIILIDE